MKSFSTTLKVTKNDLDELNHVNNVRYIEWVNTIAKAHWLNKTSKKINDSYFWILISHTINYKNAALLDDEILLKTYVTSAKGATTTRIVEIYNKNTEVLLAKSETKWCFMDSKTLKPTRITEEVAKLFF